MKPDQIEKNPSEAFYEYLLNQWKADPVAFAGDLQNFVAPFDKMGDGAKTVWQCIEAGQIAVEEFDNAAVAWLNQLDISQILPNFLYRKSAGYPLAYRMRDILMLVMPNRKGETKFPKAVGWFRDNKDKLLGINIVNDGGHWENGVKRILRENI